MARSTRKGCGKADDDYVWRFPVTPPGPVPLHEDPLLEMVRVFLADFLGIGFLTQGTEKVAVDGFALLHDRGTVYDIFPREKGETAKEKSSAKTSKGSQPKVRSRRRTRAQEEGP